ncbi:MAG: WecB/TagA/CpsF family glycosyltransferase [Pirellulaceae bacterium]
MSTKRVQLFGVEIDSLRMSEAVEQVIQWTNTPRTGAVRFVVTPNVDHTVLLQHNAGLRDAYADASLVLADGWPVVWAAKMLGKPLPERVTGSDLVPALFSAATGGQPLRTFLLGAAPGVAKRAAESIHAKWPGVMVVGTYSPPMGFEHDEAENLRILERIAETQPQLLVVGLGAPKQELWVHRHRDKIEANAALCVGATIDFLAGEKARAPRWMQQTGLEWLHRILVDPKRLAKRYAHDAVVFPRLVWREWATAPRGAHFSK